MDKIIHEVFQSLLSDRLSGGAVLLLASFVSILLALSMEELKRAISEWLKVAMTRRSWNKESLLMLTGDQTAPDQATFSASTILDRFDTASNARIK